MRYAKILLKPLNYKTKNGFVKDCMITVMRFYARENIDCWKIFVYQEMFHCFKNIVDVIEISLKASAAEFDLLFSY